MNATENETTNPMPDQTLDPMLNRPYDQPGEHSFEYPHLQSKACGDSIRCNVTLQNPRGMSTQWQRWEEALVLILERQPVEELMSSNRDQNYAIDNWTVVEEGPTNPQKPEYEIDTIAWFTLRLQKAPRGGIPAIIGEGIVHEAVWCGKRISPLPNHAPLATVQVRIELEDTQDTRKTLEKMVNDPNTRKSWTQSPPLFGYDSGSLMQGALDLIELEASSKVGFGAYIPGPMISLEEAERAAPGLEEAVAKTIRRHQTPEELHDRMQSEVDLMTQGVFERIGWDHYLNLVNTALQKIRARPE